MASDSFFVHAAEILIGAVCQDEEEIVSIEDDAIIELLEEALADDGELPDELHEAIEDFDYENFDLEASAELIADEPEEHRRALLVMVATLRASSGDFDPDDDGYYIRLAEALDLEVEADEFDPEDLGFPPEEDEDVLDEDNFDLV